MTKTDFKLCTQADELAITDFLWSIRDDFQFSNKQQVEAVTQSLFEKGGAVAGYQAGQMIALAGYFFGEPSRDFENKEVGFLYLAAVAKSVRMTRVVPAGLHFIAQTFKGMGIQEMRFHALKTDTYINRLYSHFARPQGEELNMRGHTCILYSASVDEALTYLDGQGHTKTRRPTPDSYHQNSWCGRQTHCS